MSDKRRSVVVCPGCRQPREVSAETVRLIGLGRFSGHCQRCAYSLRSRSGVVVTGEVALSLMGTKFHKAWQRMLRRCEDPRSTQWQYYGGRGIAVCERWHSFDAFTADMHDGYAEGLSIDRIDNDGPYSPENCRWSTLDEQKANRRSCRMIAFDGRSQTIAQWSRELGIDYFALRSRLDRGWSIEQALSTPAMTPTESAAAGANARWDQAGKARPPA